MSFKDISEKSNDDLSKRVVDGREKRKTIWTNRISIAIDVIIIAASIYILFQGYFKYIR